MFHIFLLLSLCIGLEAATCPEIVSRAQWGARNVKSSGAMALPVSHVFIHHTAGVTCNNKDTCSRVARQIQNYHIDTRKWADIGYSFLVGGDGRIYEGRGWKAVGAHTYGYNSKAIGLSFMGNFEKVASSAAMLKAARNLIDCGVEKLLAKSMDTETPNAQLVQEQLVHYYPKMGWIQRRETARVQLLNLD